MSVPTVSVITGTSADVVTSTKVGVPVTWLALVCVTVSLTSITPPADALLQVTTARAASSTDLTRIAAELRDRGHARLADLYARRAADATLR